MLYIVLLLVLTALGLVVAALVTASAFWAWVSIGASGLAGAMLIGDRVRKWSRGPARSATQLVTADEGAADSIGRDGAHSKPAASAGVTAGRAGHSAGAATEVALGETVGSVAEAVRAEPADATCAGSGDQSPALSAGLKPELGDHADPSGERDSSISGGSDSAGTTDTVGARGTGTADAGPTPGISGDTGDKNGRRVAAGADSTLVAAREPVGAGAGVAAGTGPRTALLASSGELTGADVDPPEEDTDADSALLVAGLSTEVLVVDEYPRYHLVDCTWLGDRATIPLAVQEARDLGFTPCALCGPDAALIAVQRRKRLSRK